jgi:hypothetical protein
MEEIKSIYQELEVKIPTRKQEAKKLIIVIEKILTLFLRILTTGLFLMAVMGILFFIIGMATGYIDTSNANFGIY